MCELAPRDVQVVNNLLDEKIAACESNKRASKSLVVIETIKKEISELNRVQDRLNGKGV